MASPCVDARTRNDRPTVSVNVARTSSGSGIAASRAGGESLLSWRHSGFSVHAGVRVEEKAAAARLGRYMARCPIVLDRLEWDGAREEVVVHPRPSRRGGPFGESERLDVLSFLARVLDPVPEPGQQQVRDWGWDSNAARGKRRKAELGVEGPLAASVSADGDRSSRRRRVSWARLIQRVSVRRQGETGLACAARATASQWLAVRPQIDPLLCRYCGGEMRLVAFVVEVSSLRRLLDGLGPGPQEAEPLSRAPPVEGQLVYEAVEG